MQDATDVLSRRYRKQLDAIDKGLWRRLLEKRIGLVLFWQDTTTRAWHAYGHWPALPDDGPWWGLPEERTIIMTTAPDALGAIEQLIQHPKIGEGKGVTVSWSLLGFEMERLAAVIRC